RFGEARLDRVREVVAQLFQLRQARLEIRPLDGQLLEPLLLRLVLFLRERVHLAELLAPLLVARERLGELVAVLAFGGLGRRRAEPALRLVVLRVRARELDVDRRQALAGGRRSLAQLNLSGTEAPELRAQLARARRL